MGEKQPSGEIVIRTLAFPRDANPAGDIFGGWVLSQMDIAGGLLSKRIVAGRTVTVGVEAMNFHKPVLVGDTLCCYCEVIKKGRTSITVKIEAWAAREYDASKRILVTEGIFTYVKVDDNRKPIPL